VLVDNVLESLQNLARAYRDTLTIPVLAITGSNGKTTTKELFSSVLSRKFHLLATEGNLNNHLGVPLTVLKIRPEHELAILEMGASGLGEIELLCSIGKPDIGIITNVGAAHLEGFGSLEGVMKGKSEMYEYLDASGGTVMFPESLHQKSYFSALRKENWISYTSDNLQGNAVRQVKLCRDYPFVSVEICTLDDNIRTVETNLYGSYNFANIVNAVKIGDFFGLEPDMIAEGIKAYIPRNNRSQMVKDGQSNEIIMDAYNANPSSMAEALNHFIQIKHSGRKIVILGDMLELGMDALSAHTKVISQLMLSKGIEALCVGKEFLSAMKTFDMEMPNIHFFRDAQEAKVFFDKMNANSCMILVKGSRGIALERIFPGIFTKPSA
jgi:UDP-N-acetylmuramoyl-tripeptide--D-alanyl-D-alanine ligase